MLDPSDRTGLYEALRPPPGAVLDCAVGTTFSLDLEALLTAPIAFALFDVDAEDDSGLEPVGLLEVIRRHADRVTVFCQAGQIAPVLRHRTVFAWLEDAVAAVAAPRRGHLFHPKVWAVRFITHDGMHVLRVLNATRNLTFDSSWDTLLRVESEPYAPGARQPEPNAKPLAKLFRSLPEWATSGCAPKRAAQAESIAADLDRVHLQVPQPFESLSFHALGVGKNRFEFPTNRRAVLVSPFLGADAVADVVSSNSVELLVSREEALDRLPTDAVDDVARVAMLSPAVDLEVDTEAPASPTDDGPGNALSGLHAKLFVFQGHKTQVFTGSANLTDAALGGNVEVLAELVGPKKHGIAALLAPSGQGQVGFSDLLLDWSPPAEPVEDAEMDELERSIGEARRALATVGLHAEVSGTGDDFVVRATSPSAVGSIRADEVEMSIHPSTTPHSTQPILPGSPVDATFSVSLEGITSFFVVKIEARNGEATMTSRFVVNATLTGAPTDRHSRLLSTMLRDTERLLRYLLLLLADDHQIAGDDLDGSADAWLGRWGSAAWDEVPLLEVLVRAVDRYPARLDQIEKLLIDLGEHRDEVLPQGFDEVWDPVLEAARSLQL